MNQKLCKFDGSVVMLKIYASLILAGSIGGMAYTNYSVDRHNAQFNLDAIIQRNYEQNISSVLANIDIYQFLNEDFGQEGIRRKEQLVHIIASNEMAKAVTAAQAEMKTSTISTPKRIAYNAIGIVGGAIVGLEVAKAFGDKLVSIIAKFHGLKNRKREKEKQKVVVMKVLGRKRKKQTVAAKLHMIKKRTQKEEAGK